MPRRAQGNVRIIAGDWRGRRLEFLDEPDLRPTPDRVRETLFNWLQPVIEGAVCLDLFAGSGALGFEALSRGAAGATLVDADARVCAQIRRQAEHFGAGGVEVVHDDAGHFIAATVVSRAYDIVFLDPPFAANLLQESCRLLDGNGGLMHSGTLIYVESAAASFAPPPDWRRLRRSRASGVEYFLLAPDAGRRGGVE